MSRPHSLSKLGTFEQCAAKYDFRYNKKLPQGDKGPAAQRGIDLHEQIDHFLARRFDGPLQSPLDFYQGFLERIRGIDGVLSEHKFGVDRQWRPLPAWDGPDVYVRAVFDTLVPPIDGQAEVFDWKSGKIYDNHKDQRELYSILTFAKYPETQRVRATSVYLDHGQQRGEIYFPNDIADARPRWEDRLGRLESATQFPFNPQFGCRWCPYSRSKGGPCLF